MKHTATKVFIGWSVAITAGCDSRVSPSGQSPSGDQSLVQGGHSARHSPKPGPSKQDIPSPTSETESVPVAHLPDYSTLKKDTSDTPIKTQVLLHVLVDHKINRNDLEHLILHLFQATKTSGGYRHSAYPTHIGIYVYTSPELFETGMGQWIGMLLWRETDGDPNISIKDEALAAAGSEPVEFDGLTEDTRRAIFQAIVRAQDRARAEADRRIPATEIGTTLETIKANGSLYNELTAGLEREVREEYGISEEQARKIVVEAITKNWPFPPR